ncbi:unnamed protein product, partial [Mesorhabditis belari]|uniref:Chitinase n=1 Tax=Mesorhabditis belari TaxID=2138241 RepID=A0AAF3EYU4_9BILA
MKLPLLFIVGSLSISYGTPVKEEMIHVNRVLDNQQYIRPCYFTNWAQYRQGRGKYAPSNYVPGLCTHILYAFGWMNADYTVRAYDDSDLPSDWGGPGQYALVNQLKTIDPNLKTLLSFGGWTFGTSLFEGMSSSPTNRATFINSVLRFVRQYNFDGIDIDWEYPTNHMAQYTAVMQELRQSVDAEGRLSGKPKLLMTAAVAAGASNMDGYDVPNIANALDFINLMSYDFWGAWDGETGMNSPLYGRAGLSADKQKWNTDWAANEWARRGMPKNKIVIGIGPYGRGWTLANPNNIQPGSTGNSPAPALPYSQQAGIATYYEICEMLAQGGKRYWHSEHQVPWLVYQNQWWSYDDAESVKNKCDYIKANGFGGAMVWALDLDDFNGQCSNGGGVVFPVIGTIARELGGQIIHGNTGTMPPITKGPPQTQPTQGPPPTGSGPFSCNGIPDGFYSDPADCTGFYRCVNGQPNHFTCPSGTYWHEDQLDCDYGKPTSGCK